MKKIIFIDTNIYLRFFDSNSSQYKSLLKSIEETKENIFVTSQIVDETYRNKIDVFLMSMNEFRKQFGLKKITLPEHLEMDSDKKLSDWNKATNELDNSSKNQVKQLNEIVQELLLKISESRDEVSTTLAKIFSSAKKPEKHHLLNARNRKDFGNPPGKKNDPIGGSFTNLQSEPPAIVRTHLIIVCLNRIFGKKMKTSN